MFVVDSGHDWMAGLDWSLHGPQSRHFSNERQFLAVTLERIAELATGEWPHEIRFFLATAGTTPAGDFLPTDLAFDPAGDPTSLYEDALPAALAHARELRIPLASRSAVTAAEWLSIEETGAWTWSCGSAARRIWSELAPLFANLAFRGRVRTFIQPVDGALEGEPLPKDYWAVPPRTAIARCARCGIDPERPFDPDAPATHHLFVDTFDLENAISEAARDSYFARLEPELRLARLIDRAQVPSVLLRRHLETMIRESEKVLTYEEMRDGLEARFYSRPSERRIVQLRNDVLGDDPVLRKLYAQGGPRVRRREGSSSD